MSSLYKCGRLILFIALVMMILIGQVWAAEPTGGYLAYQEPEASSSSWLSTIAYVVSIIITFAVVIGLAYFTSRFLGQKMGKVSASADNRILATLALGPNRAVHVVEVAGRVLLLGVTDHSITMLEEIIDQERIDKLKQQSVPISTAPSFDSVLQRQLASLQQMSQKFPAIFKDRDNNPDNESEKR